MQKLLIPTKHAPKQRHKLNPFLWCQFTATHYNNSGHHGEFIVYNALSHVYFCHQKFMAAVSAACVMVTRYGKKEREKTLID